MFAVIIEQTAIEYGLPCCIYVSTFLYSVLNIEWRTGRDLREYALLRQTEHPTEGGTKVGTNSAIILRPTFPGSISKFVV